MHIPVMSTFCAHIAKHSNDSARSSMSVVRQRPWRRLNAFLGMTLCVASATAAAPVKSVVRFRALGESAVSTSCITPDSSMIEYLDAVVTSSDSDFGIGARSNLDLPAGPASTVSAVTDSAICHRAAIAAGLSRKTPDSTSVPAVSVVRVGTMRYVVTDTLHHVGEFELSYTFDSAFTVPPLAKWGS
jgi:hypothetical protein